MKLIVGLGNPGSKYDNTRHNIGFMVLDHFAKTYNIDFKLDSRFNAELAQSNINGEKVLLLKPHTFMNLSGESVIKVINYYGIDKEDLLVIHDDMAINFNKIIFKFNSSSGGQNGIKNIIKHLKSQEFLRIKFGILNEYKKDANSFVLGKFNQDELQELNNLYQLTDNMILDFISGSSNQELMNKYN